MKLKKSYQIITVLLISIISIVVGYIGYYQLVNRTQADTLQIVSIDVVKSEQDNNFTILVTIKNPGENNISDAELNLILIQDNNIIGSDKQSVDLLRGAQETHSATFTDVLFSPESEYKAIATIYLENLLLDTKAITKQYTN
jgi:uncharacterized protein (TIGR02588 family)